MRQDRTRHTTSRRRITIALFAVISWASVTRADELRNVKVGEAIPPFTVKTLSGETLKSSDFRGRVLVLVYVSAEQQSSEAAARMAEEVAREFRGRELSLLMLTADATRIAFFRTLRERLDIETPLGLDIGRKIYGALGLIVVPTTVVIDRDGRLAHVISSCRPDYDRMLGAYVEHTLGLIDDQELVQRLWARPRNLPSDRIDRRRATARQLRLSGLDRDAENELQAALEIDADHVDTLLDLASLYIAEERFDEAEKLSERVTASDPDNRRGKLFRGIVLYHRDRLDEAESVLRDALLLNPDPILTHYYLGLIREKRGDQSAAITHYKESLTRLLREHPM